MLKRPLIFVTLLLLLPVVVFAQSDDGTTDPTATPSPEATAEPMDSEGCPQLVQDALDLTTRSCQTVGRNRVCYGHSTLDAAARPGLADFNFEEPGDIEDVIQMQSLRLSPMDVARSIWGVVLLEVQANLAVDASDNVQLVVFGDVDLTAAGTLVEVNVLADANLRQLPDTTSDILTSVTSGEELTADGQTVDGSWLRVRQPNRILAPAWISTALVSAQGDIGDLTVVEDPSVVIDSDSPNTYGPMQAFYIETGRDDAPCAQAPNSGLLIQTPEGDATVTLWIDEVIIELDATAFVQAQPNGDLTVNVLEGSAQVTSQGETRTAIAGTRIDVELDEDLGAASVPSAPVAYDPDDLQSLPTDVLDDPVEPADPLAVGEGVPAPGQWLFAWGVESLTCPDGTEIPFQSAGVPSTVSVADGGTSIIWGGGTYEQQSPGVYTRAYIDANGNLYRDTLTVQALDRISGQSLIEYADVVCQLDVPFSLSLVSGG